MWDVMALIAVLFIGLGLGALALAVFFYAIERMQNGGRDDS
jgi:Flp pilus assembly protein TadG